MKHPFKNLIGYHGVADALSENDERLPKYKAQYDKQGWDDTVTWNLFYEIVEFTLPKLKRFKEVTPCYPGHMTMDEWKSVIDKIIAWMELVMEDKISYTSEDDTIMEEGITLFKDNFYALWW